MSAKSRSYAHITYCPNKSKWKSVLISWAGVIGQKIREKGVLQPSYFSASHAPPVSHGEQGVCWQRAMMRKLLTKTIVKYLEAWST